MARDRKNTAIFTAYEDTPPTDPALSERNLLRAILLTAMADLKKKGDESKKATEFFTSDEEDYIFSFRSICNYLDIDPKHILTSTGLRKLVDQLEEDAKQRHSEGVGTVEIENASQAKN